jgi:tetratricopeptide (TPR) repeat protein
LADVFDDEDDSVSGSSDSGVLSTVEDGFGSIFSDFKKGVSATLGTGDYETRYDLGIAYREMGLFEDAIGEFRVCLDSPARRFDSLYLMGICARELGRFEDAVNHLEQALALPEIPTEKLAGVYFDLSRAQHGAGDLERACASARRVIELEPDFPGAAERLASLESGESTSPKLGKPGEMFESFDELFDDDDADEGGDEAMVEAVPVETFESFDDIVSEADEDVDEVTDSGLSNGDSQTSRKSGRKKISFV